MEGCEVGGIGALPLGEKPLSFHSLELFTSAGEEGDLPPESLGRVFSIKNLGGYVKALEMTKETPGQGAFKPNSISETYDDVEYPGRERAKSDFSNSFVSDNENSEEMYEDVYKTKSNYPKIDLDGKEALKRLQRFFKKEKDRFKMKKTKSKENIRNFFKTKKQNLEKNRMEREEKLFRERFKYDKEITVMNTAVACSNNSRNGIFDLPITPGEELEVIDITEENLVICRNSKGKYGYVLIEHLDFK
eukprot:bmy_01546T0